MDYSLNEVQNSIKNNFASFCTKEIAPRAPLLDAASHEQVQTMIKENIKKLADIGYLGLAHEEKYGGTNLDLLSQAIAGEEVAKACASTFLSAGASNGLFGMPLKMFGTQEQKEKYLPGIIKGDIIGAFGLTEPEAGSDAAAIKTTAVKKGNEWILNGSKTFITNAPIADVCLIMAYNDREAGPGAGVTGFLVEKGAPGFVVGKPFDKLGFRGSPTAEIFLEDCRVPESAVLGQVGAGFIQAMQTLEYGRIGMATVCLGIAVACMEAANAYSKERKTFGKPINRYQEISFKIADMMIMTDVSRLLIYRAALAKEAKDPESAVLASCAKLFASESATKISSMALQVHGGYGYIKEFPVERLYRDAKLGEIGEGASEIQRILIAKSILSKIH
ncbi:MAG TPA: acyl-CoA dehydrogenase family protein [Deltaproteobacteria bacterium]|jgi:alkylation response protein AidB-like acyl-CoA dehydrogenase|nr:acyl-CoA dehydrogenase family protein [Deltaproteobacteria bacterium]